MHFRDGYVRLGFTNNTHVNLKTIHIHSHKYSHPYQDFIEMKI